MSRHASQARWEAVRPFVALALLAAGLDAAIKAALYFRPTPLGSAFALDPWNYVFHAVYYAAWCHGALAALCALISQRVPRWTKQAILAQGWVTAVLLLVSAVDAECQRFLGMHLTLDWIRTYVSVDRTPAVIWDSLRADRGGAWSALLMLGVAVSFGPLSAPIVRRSVRWRAPGLRVQWGALVLCLLLPTLLWNVIPGGRQRQSKVCPALLLVYREFKHNKIQLPEASALADATKAYQERWRALDTTRSWEFDEPAFPLKRSYRGEPPARSERAPNVILLSLETFRAKDIKRFNPGLAGTAPTPFLDALAARDDSAYYERYYASGVPTVYAFMAMHASLLPHPRYGIHNQATTRHIEGFPAALRRHGYYTLHFTGSDPDWDSQRLWLDRWYDEVSYAPADRERDRLTFRRAAERLREVGRSGKPFFASLSSISNHTPFRSPESGLDVTDGNTTRDRLHNTMHYTDDVVRELYQGLENEPWFANTIWIITGDHAFDLGDRGESAGHDNLRHETTWVPLIVHGKDSRLPRGRKRGVASHLDLAPTIAELAGVFDDNSYMGHSLLHQDAQRAFTVVGRANNYAYESSTFSLYQPPQGSAWVYQGTDLEQRQALAEPAPELLREAELVARSYDILVGYTVDTDHVLPRTDLPAVKIAHRVQAAHEAEQTLQ